MEDEDDSEEALLGEDINDDDDDDRFSYQASPFERRQTLALLAQGEHLQKRKLCGVTYQVRSIQQWQLDGRSSGQMGADERKAIWHEVFFNLAFATACGRISSYLLQSSEWTAETANLLYLLAFVSMYLPLYLQWMCHGLYLNRFDNSDLTHNVYQLMNVALMCLAAANVSACTEVFLLKTDRFGSCSDFSYIMFAFRLLSVIMYARCALFIPQKTLFCLRKAIELLIFAVFWLFNGVLQSYLYGTVTFFITWWVVTLAELVIPLVTPRIFPQKVGFVAVNIDLLVERFGLFFVTVLGDSVVAATLISPLSMRTNKLEDYAISVIMIFLSFCFKLTYHDCNRATNDDIDLHALRWHHWTGILWIMMHLPLTAGIVLMSSFFIETFQESVLPTRQRWYFCSAMALTVVCLTVLQLLHKKSKQRVRVSPAIRISVRFLAAAVTVLLPLIPMPLWALFLSLLGLNLVYTVLDMLGNQAVAEPTYDHDDQTAGTELAAIFQTDNVRKDIHGLVVGGQIEGYDHFRMQGRVISSAYI